jgi:chromosome segregation ATPase
MIGKIKVPEKKEDIMNSELSNTSERKTYEHLGLVANEVIKMREVLNRVASRESDLKGMLGDLADCLQNLTNRLSRLEGIVREASLSAVEEAQRDDEITEGFQAEKAALEAQLHEKEEILQTRETSIKQLEGSLAANTEDLERRIVEKEKLLEVRDSALKDLRSAMGALSALAEQLRSLETGHVIAGQEPEEQQSEKDNVEINEKEIEDLKERMEAEMEKLRVQVREKDTILAAKGMEVEMIKQKTESKIRGLEDQLRSRSSRGKTRFVSFLTNAGEKREKY